jgi:hypothetical protein
MEIPSASFWLATMSTTFDSGVKTSPNRYAARAVGETFGSVAGGAACVVGQVTLYTCCDRAVCVHTIKPTLAASEQKIVNAFTGLCLEMVTKRVLALTARN